MAESIILVKFNVESEAYEAFSEVKKAFMAPEFMISQACVVKKENGQILTKDCFDTGIESTNDARFGGIMGMLIGFLAGPLGILLGGGIGLMIGGIKDAADVAKNSSMIEKVCAAIPEGRTALIALVSELKDVSFDRFFDKYDTEILRLDAAVVAEELKKAQTLEKQMEREARQKLREEQTENNWKQVEESRAQLKQEFEELKKRFKK